MGHDVQLLDEFIQFPHVRSQLLHNPALRYFLAAQDVQLYGLF